MKVNIIGRGTGWENAPRNELTWGVTLINLKRDVDLVIDMNVYEDGRWGELERQGAIKSREKAVSCGTPYVDLKTYPIDEIISFFKTDYFSNTVDYAIALAIYTGFTEIVLYGINMLKGSEYAYQKAGVEFWIGQAMGRGITVTVHGTASTILKTRDGLLYGYGTKQQPKT
ncbi:MAG: hypothetical protein WC332_02405 [Clostridia bacterium]|jgi:hypothetical protein